MMATHKKRLIAWSYQPFRHLPSFPEAPGGFEPPVKLLQSFALPLGHGAIAGG